MKTYGRMEVKFLIFWNPAPAEGISSPWRFFRFASWDSPLYPLGGKRASQSNSCQSHCLSVRFEFFHQRFCFRHSHWSLFLAIYSFVWLFCCICWRLPLPYLGQIYGINPNSNFPTTPRFCHRPASSSISSHYCLRIRESSILTTWPAHYILFGYLYVTKISLLLKGV